MKIAVTVGAVLILLVLAALLLGQPSGVVASSTSSEAASTYVILHSDTITNGNGVAVAPIAAFDAYAELTVQATGMVSATLNWEGTTNGANWVSLLATNVSSGASAATATAAGVYRMDVTGLASVRARVSGVVTSTTDTIDVVGFLTAP